MPLHKKRAEALFVFVFCARSCELVQSSQGIVRRQPQDPQGVEFHADGLLQGSSVMRKDIVVSDAESRESFPWSSVPQCARELFGQYVPELANIYGMRELLPGIDAFYIIHDEAYPKRKLRLENDMKTSRLGEIATWVTWFSEDDINKIPHGQLACVFNRSYGEPLFTQSMTSPLSRNLKHLWVYHEMVQRGLRNVLVMEDNAIFRKKVERIIDSLQDLRRGLPEDYGVVMLSDDDLAHGHEWRAEEIEQSFRTKHAAQKVTEHLYHGALGHRGAGGYLIDGPSASKILKYVHKKVKVDSEADALMENALGSDGFFWYDPPLWVQTQSPVMAELEIAPIEAHHKPEQESHVDAQWAFYHRYLGTSGHDDP